MTAISFHRERGGALTTSLSVDGYGDVLAHAATWTGGGELRFDDGHDDLGRVVTRTETVDGISETLDYTYDPDGQLTDVYVGGAPRYHYDYDPQGNRVGWIDPSGSGTADYDDQDRLVRYGTRDFGYNADGQLWVQTDTATGATTTYGYDELGSLLTVDLPSGASIEYRVDGLGRRVQKSVGGTPVQGWLYQDGLNPVAELDAAGSVVQVFVYASRGHVPDLIVRGTDTYRVITDPVGSVRRVVEVSTGAVVQAIDYDPSGRVLRDSNPGFQPFGFAGGLYDRDTGLVRFGARDYDASVGRWTTKDPIGFAGGDSSLYVYVRNDPINHLDANGLLLEELLGVVRLPDALGGEVRFDNIIGTGNVIGLNVQWFGGSDVRAFLIESVPLLPQIPTMICEEPLAETDAGLGFMIGPSVAGNVAWGSGPWSGPFDAVGVAFPGGASGSFFQSPDKSWQGVSAGYAPGPAGAAYTRTYYHPL